MNFVLGVLLLWVGSALLFLATHSGEIDTPWGMYRDLLARVRGQA